MSNNTKEKIAPLSFNETATLAPNEKFGWSGSGSIGNEATPESPYYAWTTNRLRKTFDTVVTPHAFVQVGVTLSALQDNQTLRVTHAEGNSEYGPVSKGNFSEYVFIDVKADAHGKVSLEVGLASGNNCKINQIKVRAPR
ncbi:hypothetical protein [Pseudomonas sp. GM48]|uniref:hypothetical protein n=1 Tax=Pseudomonas sp. GM48 TaxID=1144330 RepID=UPI00027030C2|nr:hypothetical protein [Pseudomonas sp. GM48]EJM60466.1 hypothetical protein PMI28_01209 [Pseudomonas sp. GM48]